MSSSPRRAGRFVLAPVAAGGAVWDDAVDLVLTPLQLASPVPIVLALPRGRSGR